MTSSSRVPSRRRGTESGEIFTVSCLVAKWRIVHPTPYRV